jgi:hypothetical protein
MPRRLLGCVSRVYPPVQPLRFVPPHPTMGHDVNAFLAAGTACGGACAANAFCNVTSKACQCRPGFAASGTSCRDVSMSSGTKLPCPAEDTHAHTPAHAACNGTCAKPNMRCDTARRQCVCDTTRSHFDAAAANCIPRMSSMHARHAGLVVRHAVTCPLRSNGLELRRVAVRARGQLREQPVHMRSRVFRHWAPMHGRYAMPRVCHPIPVLMHGRPLPYPNTCDAMLQKGCAPSRARPMATAAARAGASAMTASQATASRAPPVW